MQQVFNFSAGPAMLPHAVLEQAQKELLNWNGLGTSVMEISHRGKPFIEVAEQAEQDLRELLGVPANYSVLFMHGGGRGQFSTVPLNISKAGELSEHLVTGQWSISAEKEAQKFTKTNIVATTKTDDNGLVYVPEQKDWAINPNAAYFQYCPNETVEGIEIDWVPQTGGVPLVADMSSNILSKQINVEDYGILYAGAQKNIGPSGLTLVIINNDLLGKARPDAPSIFNYELQANADSMVNTPPTFSWYLAGLVFKWLKGKGGIAAIEAQNKQKADLLYNFIDQSDFYANKVAVPNRSKMNVTFSLAHAKVLDPIFLQESNSAGLAALKGHRAVGGMRASIYNAMPIEGVKALIEFMKEFERTKG
jgi:phosphoserine aminotransferase